MHIQDYYSNIRTPQHQNRLLVNLQDMLQAWFLYFYGKINMRANDFILIFA